MSVRKRIVILGSGISGLSAALTLAREGKLVDLISNGPSERSGSVMAEGGINAALNTMGQNDHPYEHAQATSFSAAGCADEEAIREMAEAAPGLLLELYQLGVRFNLNEQGKIALRPFGGQKKRRTAYAKDSTGKQVMTALIDAVRQYEVLGQVRRYDHHSLINLSYTDGHCSGILVRDDYSG